jgi:hypothetical protein
MASPGPVESAIAAESSTMPTPNPHRTAPPPPSAAPPALATGPAIAAPPNAERATAEPARRRHTPLILLATAAVAALAAGVVWGVVTAPGHHAAAQSPDHSQATPMAAAEQAPYRAAEVAAKPDGPGQITVTWRTPSSMAGVSSFLVRASLYGHWDVQQAADPTATSRAFTGLTPGKYYCFVVYTIVERPGAAQPQFAMTTADDKACAVPGK